MAQIDYSSIFTGITISADSTKLASSATLISFPFRDRVFTGNEFTWIGSEGFQRFLDIFNPRAVIGTNPNGTKLLADNIGYLQQIIGPGVAAMNIGTLCIPNWVGSLTTTGIDPRHSYWVKFSDDIEQGSAITGSQDTGTLHNTWRDFYDFDNAIDGESWGTNTITDWAFRNSNTGIPSKTITGDLIRANWKLRNVAAGKTFFIGYPFAEESPDTSTGVEFGLKYPDQLVEDIISQSFAATYVEASSAWGGSLLKLTPGQGYTINIKSSQYLDTSIIDTEDGDSVQLFVDEYVEGFGIPWDSYEATLGGVTYKAIDYTLNEVKGNNSNELFNNPEAFAGFVNWGKHDGVWNPDNLPQSNIELCKKFENHGLLRYNGILDTYFNHLSNVPFDEDAHINSSFMFIVWYDPIRSQHFIGTGHKLHTNQGERQGFCSNETDVGIGHSISNFGGYNEYMGNYTGDIRTKANHYIKLHVDNYCVNTAYNLFTELDSQATYWTEGGDVSGTLFPQFQKQRPFMLAGAAPDGFSAVPGPEMPWTYVLFHAPTNRFFQLRPAHVRYKVDNMNFPEAFKPENLTKVMHYYMDNHRNTTEGEKWTEAYSGSDAEGSWTLSTATGSGWHAMQGVSCIWPDQVGDSFYSPSEPYLSIVNSEGNIESVWLAQANNRYVEGNQIYVEVPMQLVMQEANSITWHKEMNDISTGPFERDVDKSVEGG